MPVSGDRDGELNMRASSSRETSRAAAAFNDFSSLTGDCVRGGGDRICTGDELRSSDSGTDCITGDLIAEGCGPAGIYEVHGTKHIMT